MPEHEQEQIDAQLDALADRLTTPKRSPVLHWPDEQGLEYENVTFPSRDGVPLEGWFIPASGSTRTVICNHPMGFNRSGLPTHLEPWRTWWGPSGNAFEVDFLPDYAILHRAGYNVLAYDLRNHGLSGAGNGGIASSGIFEARDVVGAVTYALTRPGVTDDGVALFSRCLGAASTFSAFTQFPLELDRVRCLVAAQPISPPVTAERMLALVGLEGRLADLDRAFIRRTGLGFAVRDLYAWARNVHVPTFLYQVRQDVTTRPIDVQTMFDNLPDEPKKLQWVEGTTARWDGYLEFQRRPELMLDWFATHLG